MEAGPLSGFLGSYLSKTLRWLSPFRSRAINIFGEKTGWLTYPCGVLRPRSKVWLISSLHISKGSVPNFFPLVYILYSTYLALCSSQERQYLSTEYTSLSSPGPHSTISGPGPVSSAQNEQQYRFPRARH